MRTTAPRPLYVAIEGPPGTGKTALARALAARCGSRLVLDRTEENPFLGEHREGRRHAFQAQVFFLLARSAQQEELRQDDLAGVVADYAYGRLDIYASLLLSPDELALYRRVAEHLGPPPRDPDAVVYLQARPDDLAERLRRARRAAPRPEFLEEVIRAYAEHFYLYEESPLLVVPASDADLASPAAVAEIEAAIRERRRGISTFTPAGARQLSFR